MEIKETSGMRTSKEDSVWRSGKAEVVTRMNEPKQSNGLKKDL